MSRKLVRRAPSLTPNQIESALSVDGIKGQMALRHQLSNTLEGAGSKMQRQLKVGGALSNAHQ